MQKYEISNNFRFKTPHIRKEHTRFYSNTGKVVNIKETIVRKDLLPYIKYKGESITIQNIYTKMGRVS